MWAYAASALWFLLLLLITWKFFRPVLALFVASLPYLRGLYLLRVPILTAVGVWGFCFAAFLLPGTRSLLGNAFDLGPESDIVWWSMLLFMSDVFLITLSACLLGSVVMVTWRLVRLYGPKRFLDEDSVSIFNRDYANIAPNIKWWHLIFFLSLIAGPVVIGAIVKSSITSSTVKISALEVGLGILAAGVGVLLSLGFLWIAHLLQRRWTRSAYASRPQDAPTSLSRIVGSSQDFFFPTVARSDAPDNFLERARRHEPRGQWAQRATNFIDERLPSETKPGYIEKAEDGNPLILPGHVAAGILLALTFVIYLAIGVLVYAFAYHINIPTLSFVPTLCYLMLLAMLLCWGFSGLAFFFDRYRIPVLMPLVVVLLIASVVGSDYYYPTATQQADTEVGGNGSVGENDPPLTR